MSPASSRTCSSSAPSASSLSWRRPVSTSRMPLAANARASAVPIPDVAPVMIATLPSRSPMPILPLAHKCQPNHRTMPPRGNMTIHGRTGRAETAREDRRGAWFQLLAAASRVSRGAQWSKISCRRKAIVRPRPSALPPAPGGTSGRGESPRAPSCRPGRACRPRPSGPSRGGCGCQRPSARRGPGRARAW